MTLKDQLSRIKVGRIYLYKGKHWQYEWVLEQLLSE
jgi:hypothetical protein